MTQTIILTDLLITNIDMNYVDQNVKVTFQKLDNDNKVWETGIAYFWVTLPIEPRDIDFQLPSSYFPTLLQLQTDADAALTARFLV